ncbi:hypothetical protein LINPERHAP2_LOCUS24574 [Linum perenne]
MDPEDIDATSESFMNLINFHVDRARAASNEILQFLTENRVVEPPEEIKEAVDNERRMVTDAMFILAQTILSDIGQQKDHYHHQEQKNHYQQ